MWHNWPSGPVEPHGYTEGKGKCWTIVVIVVCMGCSCHMDTLKRGEVLDHCCHSGCMGCSCHMDTLKKGEMLAAMRSRHKQYELIQLSLKI